MRTTILVEEQLRKEAKQQAVRRGKSLTSVIEDALRESLSRQREAGQRDTVHVNTNSGNEVLPGVDLDDSAALLDLMESSNDPARCDRARLCPPGRCTRSPGLSEVVGEYNQW
jgi:hypothetical protein